MDRSLQVMDDTLLNFTIWNYTADNTNAHGDQWNDETCPFSAATSRRHRRYQLGWARPAGGGPPLRARHRREPLRMHFDLRKKVFKFKFRHDPQISAPTEFFIPIYQYPKGTACSLRWDYEIDQPINC